MESNCRPLNAFTFTTRVLVGCLICLSNILTIVTLSRTKQGIGQKGKLYLLSLSCADLILGPSLAVDLALRNQNIYCIVVPEGEVVTDDMVRNKRIAFSFMLVLYVIPLGCALFSLLAIAIDRLLAVSKPIFYMHHVTKTRIQCLILFIWSYTSVFITSVVGYYARQTSPEQILKAYGAQDVMPDMPYKAGCLSQIYGTIFANVLFYFITIRYIQKIDARTTSQAGNFKRTKRYLLMSGVTVGVLLSLWAPYLITVNIVEQNDRNNADWLENYFIPFTYTIVYCNSWINPLLYCLLNKDYRKAFKDVIQFKGANRINNGSPTVSRVD